MTHRNSRQFDRAVRDYQRAHPGTTLPEAREAVAARAGRQPGLPARIPAAPLPRPGETLPAYTQRVAAAAGVHRHRAMELLGLEPGVSATERLDEVAAGLPDRTVRALVAATGMTPGQARALTTPAPTATAAPDLETLARRVLDEKLIQPGGKGKTRTDARTLARLLAEADRQLPLLIDTDRPRDLGWPDPAPYRPVIIDTWPGGGPALPTDPELFDTVTKDLATGPDPDARPAE
ncbi:hypothetical protein ACH4PU_32685 [Streptomyces sp. NPDC021100]|uniref:hypothetical protein n=1 Tax=Streptomyces sp. NPDC021100 TaxID=3365114 RepID=UPI003791719C